MLEQIENNELFTFAIKCCFLNWAIFFLQRSRDKEADTIVISGRNGQNSKNIEQALKGHANIWYSDHV